MRPPQFVQPSRLSPCCPCCPCCCQPRPDASVTQMNAPSSFPLSLRLFVSVRVGVCVSYVWHRLARAEDLGGLSDQVATAALRQAYQPLFKCIKSIVLPLLLSYIYYTRIVTGVFHTVVRGLLRVSACFMFLVQTTARNRLEQTTGLQCPLTSTRYNMLS